LGLIEALRHTGATTVAKVGIFGGAFDPPHNAHVALAGLAQKALDLDVLHIMPTGHAWHKTRVLSPAEHRLAMTQLAFDSLPGVVVDDREIKRAGPTFTIDTLKALQLQYPGAQLHLIMGADQFAAFQQWHEWQAILQTAIICIAARARFDWPSGRFDAYQAYPHRFIELPLPEMAVSATQVRQLLAARPAAGLGENQPTADLLPASVERYIAQHQLYQTSQTAPVRHNPLHKDTE
jgi:nicotinate-nucleotide adenylyltransferase